MTLKNIFSKCCFSTSQQTFDIYQLQNISQFNLVSEVTNPANVEEVQEHIYDNQLSLFRTVSNDISPDFESLEKLRRIKQNKSRTNEYVEAGYALQQQQSGRGTGLQHGQKRDSKKIRQRCQRLSSRLRKKSVDVDEGEEDDVDSDISDKASCDSSLEASGCWARLFVRKRKHVAGSYTVNQDRGEDNHAITVDDVNDNTIYANSECSKLACKTPTGILKKSSCQAHDNVMVTDDVSPETETADTSGELKVELHREDSQEDVKNNNGRTMLRARSSISSCSSYIEMDLHVPDLLYMLKVIVAG